MVEHSMPVPVVCRESKEATAGNSHAEPNAATRLGQAVPCGGLVETLRQAFGLFDVLKKTEIRRDDDRIAEIIMSNNCLF